MAPYVYSRDGRSLSIYGSECQIWKTLLLFFTTIDPNKNISKTRQASAREIATWGLRIGPIQRMGAAPGVIHTGRFFVLIPL
jgi:hypothetical protein